MRTLADIKEIRLAIFETACKNPEVIGLQESDIQDIAEAQNYDVENYDDRLAISKIVMRKFINAMLDVILYENG